LLPLIIIIGPTAVGKSALGVDLAHALNGEIISGDSIQVYRKLNIGSAKPTVIEQDGIPHHLIDFLDPTDPFTVARFQTCAHQWICDIRSRGKIPLVVGGTGLYIRSILDDYDFPEEGSDPIKKKWLDYVQAHGNLQLHHALRQCDPVSADKLHPNDIARIIRALEVYEITGKPLSEQRNYHEKDYANLDASIVYIGLTAPRAFIYERINQRCEDMIRDGLIEEVAGLMREGYSPRLKALQSIGYRHVVYYLRGIVCYDEMLRLFKRDTRRFAKRQLTWFRRDPRIKWYDITINTRADILNDVAHTCREFQNRVQL